MFGSKYNLIFSVVSLFLIILHCRLTSQRSSARLGPFTMIVYKIEKCSNKAYNVQLHPLRFTRYNRTTIAYSGNITFPSQFDDTVQILFESAIRGNGGWKEGYYRLSIPRACTDTTNLIPIVFKTLLRTIGYEKCPIKPGTYEVKNLNVQPHSVEALPIGPYGKFRIRLSFVKNKIAQFCLLIYVELVPK